MDMNGLQCMFIGVYKLLCYILHVLKHFPIYTQKIVSDQSFFMFLFYHSFQVEHVIREEKTMSAYELIELYCELIVARLPIIESQKYAYQTCQLCLFTV